LSSFRFSLISLIRFFLFLIPLTLAALVKKTFRPWISSHSNVGPKILDYGPSLFYIFGMIMLVATLIAVTGKLNRLKYQTMAGVIIGALFYEATQIFRSDRWFRWDDAIFTVAGGLLAIFTEFILSRFDKTSDSKTSGN
jgi:VanZ family protein